MNKELRERVEARIHRLTDHDTKNVIVWESFDEPETGDYPVSIRAVIYWKDYSQVSIYNGTLMSDDLVMDGLMDFSAAEFKSIMEAMKTYL